MMLCVPLTVVLHMCGACAGGMQEAIIVSLCGSSCTFQASEARPSTILNQLEHKRGPDRLQSDLLPLTNIVAL